MSKDIKPGDQIRLLDGQAPEQLQLRLDGRRMTGELKLNDAKNSYTYTNQRAMPGRKLYIERSAVDPGGLALKAASDVGHGDSAYTFIPAEDVDAIIEAMQEMRKRTCEHCNGTGKM